MQLDQCKCQHTRENHYMNMGKCIWMGCSCKEFSIDYVEGSVPTNAKRYIPTKAEVMAKGYTSEAANSIIAERLRDTNA